MRDDNVRQRVVVRRGAVGTCARIGAHRHGGIADSRHGRQPRDSDAPEAGWRERTHLTWDTFNEWASLRSITSTRRPACSRSSLDGSRPGSVHAVFESETAALVGLPPGRPTFSRDDLPKSCDLVLVLGGDGTFIGMASRIARSGTDVPILGVNFGSLGFLTEVTLDELYDSLEAVLEGHAHLETRMMLRARTRRQGKALEDRFALNDVVITERRAVADHRPLGRHRRSARDAGARRRVDRRDADGVLGVQPRRGRPDRPSRSRRDPPDANRAAHADQSARDRPRRV